MNTAAESVLFIPPKGLTGAAQSLAAAREIRLAHRKARMICLTVERLQPLFEASPYFNSVDTGGDPENWKEAVSLVRRLRQTEFAAIYDFRASVLTDKIRRAARTGLWCCPQDGGGRIPPEGAAHPLDRMEMQLRAAGVLTEPTRLIPDMSWLNSVGRRTRMLEPAYFGMNDPYAVLLPCSASRENAPVFKPEEWAAIAAAMLEQGLKPIVLGTVSDRPAANAVRASAPQAKEFLGRTNMLQHASLCRHANLVVSALAPPAHLAAAAAADVVTVYAAGDPDPLFSVPRGEGAVVALTPSASRVSVGDVMQTARALGAFRREAAPLDA